ncbi:MAG TPA: hypothetical protein PKV67_01915 [Hyphomonas sp.]|uniref:hypothetical protein n=1 Tax=Hyphomonas TaxID=85 RepID=UPI0012FC7F71|nr:MULTISPECIES: hypothetical protein [Hyphomonas]HRI99506.1 hypothetical protein [Hyphomonas sp.]HRK65914.1 hypothetical protein [Hyphomonas sp.]
MAFFDKMPNIFMALIVMIAATLVIAPAADALACSSEAVSGGQQAHAVVADERADAGIRVHGDSEAKHGLCNHGHSHTNMAWRVDSDTAFALLIVDAGMPRIGYAGSWSHFVPDGLERPPRA